MEEEKKDADQPKAEDTKEEKKDQPKEIQEEKKENELKSPLPE